MSRISNWLYIKHFNAGLRKLIPSLHAIKNETDDLKSQCISEILYNIKESWIKITECEHKLRMTIAEKINAVIYTDDHTGKQKKVPEPAFSVNDKSHIKSKHTITLFLICFFVLAEGVLAYLSACIIIPGAKLFLKILVGLFFGLIFMVAIDYGIKSYFDYLHAVEKQKLKEITDEKLREFKVKMIAGIVLMVIATIAIIAAGISRIYFLENIPNADGLDEAKRQAILNSSKWGSVLTMLATILVSFILGFLKYDFSKIHRKYIEFRNWSKSYKLGDKHILAILRQARLIRHVAEVKTEKYWRWVIQIKRIFIKTEHDVKYSPDYEEFEVLRKMPGFVVTEEIYRKFSPIQSCHADLFRFGIVNDPVIKDKIDYAMNLLSLSKEQLEKYIALLEGQ